MHYENGDCLIGCCGSLVDWMSHTYDLMTQNFNWTFSVVLKYPYNFFLLAQLTVQSDFTVIHNVSYNLCFSLCRLLNTFIHFHFNFLCSYLYLNIKLFLKFDWFTWLSSIFYITLQIIYIYNYFHLRRTFFFGGGGCLLLKLTNCENILQDRIFLLCLFSFISFASDSFCLNRACFVMQSPEIKKTYL